MGFKHGRVCFLCVCMLVRWVEEDPREIMQSVHECIERTCEKLCKLNIDVSNIKGRTLTGGRQGVENVLSSGHRGKFIDIYLFFFLFPAVGVTNQRETTLVWDKDTGEPLYNAIGKSVRISASMSDSLSCKKVDCVMWEVPRGMTRLHQVEASCVVSVPAPPKTVRAVIQQQSLPLTQAFSLKSQFISELFSPLIQLGGCCVSCSLIRALLDLRTANKC